MILTFALDLLVMLLLLFLLLLLLSHLVMSTSSWPHGLHHFCPSLSPGVCSNSWPLSGWCNPAISSSVPPLLLFLPSTIPSIRVFSKESALHIRWSKYWSFSFCISLSYEYSELISFIIEWFDLRAVQGTLQSLLQHHNWKHQFLGTQSYLWIIPNIHRMSTNLSQTLPKRESREHIQTHFTRPVSPWYQNLTKTPK